uniref:Protein kinase domain-containing protein n=1 Tax=Chenopodium quinoa TaxID=63459 RepID=A0A803MR85_CHEQI
NYAIQMDWIRRLMVTLGFARGLQYLHELADPLIIYKDVKSNILLDECMTAKVADFGLFKLFGDTDQKVYVTTKVKGTMVDEAVDGMDRESIWGSVGSEFVCEKVCCSVEEVIGVEIDKFGESGT